MPAATKNSAHKLLLALTKRFHITVSNKHSHFHTTTETLLNLQFNGKDIDTHNDRVRKILADTEEVGLGVIPEPESRKASMLRCFTL